MTILRQKMDLIEILIRSSLLNICSQRWTLLEKLYLVDEFAVERNANGGQEQACVLIGGGGGVHNDVATWDHLRRVPGELSVCRNFRQFLNSNATHMS